MSSDSRICETEPTECFLEYHDFNNNFDGKYGKMQTTGKPGFSQKATLSYEVFIVHKGGKSTCGCHIIQSLFTMERKMLFAAVRRHVPAVFTPIPKHKFYSWSLLTQLVGGLKNVVTESSTLDLEK